MPVSVVSLRYISLSKHINRIFHINTFATLDFFILAIFAKFLEILIEKITKSSSEIEASSDEIESDGGSIDNRFSRLF